MRPLAEKAGFEPSVHKWSASERAELLAELDAAFFILYGIGRKDAEYVLSTFSGIQKEKGVLTGDITVERIMSHYDKLCEKTRK